jgi:hypothetical protein
VSSLFVKKLPSFWPTQTGKGNMCFKGKLKVQISNKTRSSQSEVGCALTFASEAKFEIEAKILFRFEAKKKPDFT